MLSQQLLFTANIVMKKWLHAAVAAAAKLLQSHSILCNRIDGSPPGSAVPGILQARTLEWVAISFSNVWKWKGKVKFLSHVRLLATPWTAAYQAPPSMEFSRQEYWSGVPLLICPICGKLYQLHKITEQSDGGRCLQPRFLLVTSLPRELFPVKLQ